LTDEQNEDQTTQQPEADDSASEFGSSILAFLITLFSLFCALYWGPWPNDTVDLIIKWFFYVAAGVFALIFLVVFGTALSNEPAAKQFLKMLLGLGEGQRTGWEFSLLGGGCILLGILIHLIAVTIFDVSGFALPIVQFFIVVLLFFGLVWSGIAADSLLIKPFIETLNEKQDDLNPLAETFRKRIGAAITILIAVAGLIVAILQLLED